MMKGKIVVRSTKAYGTVEVELHALLTSKLDEGEWSDSRFGHFPFGKRGPSTHSTGVKVDLRAGLGVLEPVNLWH